MAEMRAVIAPEPGGSEALRIVSRPRPEPGEGEILVRVAAAGVNRPDVIQRQGHYPPPPGASDIFGLEIAGTVEVAGSGASRFPPGARIMALVAGGGYADYAVVHESNVLPVPDSLSFIEAGAVPETYFTVWTNVFERAGLRPGETLLVHGGTSGIGTTAIQLAKAFGSRVVATAGSAEKCQACLGLGADFAVDYRNQDFVAEAKAATNGKGPDVILDMVGGDYMARNIKAAAVDGRIVQIAFLKGSRAEVDMMPLMLKRLTFTGSTLRARSVEVKAGIARALSERVLPLLSEGRCKPVIDSTFPLEQTVEAHRRMEAGEHIGKIVLEIG